MNFEFPGVSSVWTDSVELPIKTGDTLEIRLFCKHRYADGNSVEEQAKWYVGNALNSSLPQTLPTPRIVQQMGGYCFIPF